MNAISVIVIIVVGTISALGMHSTTQDPEINTLFDGFKELKDDATVGYEDLFEEEELFRNTLLGLGNPTIKITTPIASSIKDEEVTTEVNWLSTARLPIAEPSLKKKVFISTHDIVTNDTLLTSVPITISVKGEEVTTEVNWPSTARLPIAEPSLKKKAFISTESSTEDPEMKTEIPTTSSDSTFGLY